MAKKTSKSSYQLEEIFKVLGENFKSARLRRNISTTLLAQRAGMTRSTLSAIEKGSPSVSFAAYANVLFSLGLEQDLLKIASDDVFGKKVLEAQILTGRKRVRRSK